MSASATARLLRGAHRVDLADRRRAVVAIDIGSTWDITQPNLTFGSITSHAFGIRNWVERWQWSINPPMWSIALELQIYSVFAVVLLPLVRSIGSRRTAVVAFAISLALTALGFGFAHPWMLGLFAVGVVAAQMTVAGRQRSSRDWAWLTMAGVAVVVASAAREPIRNEDIQLLLSEVVVGFATAVMVVILASRGGTGTASAGESIAGRCPGGPLRAVGRASNSLYLVHYPIVAVIHLTVVQDKGWGSRCRCSCWRRSRLR